MGLFGAADATVAGATTVADAGATAAATDTAVTATAATDTGVVTAATDTGATVASDTGASTAAATSDAGSVTSTAATDTGATSTASAGAPEGAASGGTAEPTSISSVNEPSVTTSPETTNVSPTISEPGASTNPEAGNYWRQSSINNAPMQTTPGTGSLTGEHINDLGQAEPWTAHYDQYGRLIGRTDYALGDQTQGIEPTHYHVYSYNEYSSGFGNGAMPFGDHIPGEFNPSDWLIGWEFLL